MKVQYHQQLNEDHQHQLDRYNDVKAQVAYPYKQHDKANKKSDMGYFNYFINNLLDYEEMKSIQQIVLHLVLLLIERHSEHYQVIK